MLFHLALALVACAAAHGQEFTLHGPGGTNAGINFPINERASGSIGANVPPVLGSEFRNGFGMTYTGRSGSTLDLDGSIGESGPAAGVNLNFPINERTSGSVGFNYLPGAGGEVRTGLTYTGRSGVTLGLDGSVGQGGSGAGVSIQIPLGK